MRSKISKQKVSFTAKKKAVKPVKVEFYTRKGEKVSFITKKKVIAPTNVKFYKRDKLDEEVNEDE